MSAQDPPAVWEDGRWAGLPSLDGDIDVDVCVVGLGGSGLSCIHELRDHGVRVAGIDAGSHETFIQMGVPATSAIPGRCRCASQTGRNDSNVSLAAVICLIRSVTMGGSRP